ncbi:hypothetical protein JXQ70_03290 [bacterium]|nr:hypothetical protein [bacterium]
MFSPSFPKSVSMLLVPCVVVFMLLASTVISGAEEVSEQALEQAAQHIKKGIELYQESDFNQAIVELNSGLEILEKSISSIKAAKELVNAHLHLGLAYIGVNNNTEAKNQFKEIVRLEPDYTLDSGAYSQKVVSLFNEAKAEYLSQVVSQRQTEQAALETAGETPSEPAPAKKPYYKKWWFWTLIGAGAVGIAAASSSKEDEEEDEPLLEDNFDDGDYKGWVPLGDSAPFWKVQNKKLVHIDNYVDWTWDIIRNGSSDWNLASFDVTLSNFTGDPDNYEAIIIFGMKSQGTWFHVTFNYGSLCLHQLNDWDDVWYVSTDYPLAPNKTYKVSIQISGSDIKVLVNNQHELSHGFNGAVVGQVALAASSPTPIQFDDVVIWPVSEKPGPASGKKPVKQTQNRLEPNKIPVRSHQITERTGK